MSTYLSLGQGALLVGQPTPVYLLTYLLTYLLRCYLGQPTPVYLLTYLLTYLLRCYLGAKLVYPLKLVYSPTPV